MVGRLYGRRDLKAYEKPSARIGSVISMGDVSCSAGESLREACARAWRRTGFDAVLMFKILALQKLHGLAADETSYQIVDRHSFKTFLGMGRQDRIPDGQTIADFRNHLIGRGMMEELFQMFLRNLKSEHGLGLAKDGVIVDASFVEVPINRSLKLEVIKNLWGN